jgi:hypothetical protein
MPSFDLKQFFAGITLIVLGMGAITAALNPIGKPSLLPLMLVHIGAVAICFGIAGPFRLPVLGLCVAYTVYFLAMGSLIWQLSN